MQRKTTIMNTHESLKNVRAHALSDALKRDVDFDAHLDAALDACDKALEMLRQARDEILAMRSTK